MTRLLRRRGRAAYRGRSGRSGRSLPRAVVHYREMRNRYSFLTWRPDAGLLDDFAASRVIPDAPAFRNAACHRRWHPKSSLRYRRHADP